MPESGFTFLSDEQSLKVTYATENGQRYRLSFIPQPDGNWLRIKEEVTDEDSRYVGSETVTKLQVEESPSELDDGL